MLSNNSIYVLIFASGFFGGFGHCLGMCGPIVMSCSIVADNRKLTSHILYNIGRVSTYALLGGIVGVTGSIIGKAGGFYGIQRHIMLLGGISIIIMGIAMTGWVPVMKYIENRHTLLSVVMRAFRKITSGEIHALSFYPAGAVMGFIPCGLVYTALAATAGASLEQSNHFMAFLHGVLLMLLFGMGTVPAMLVLGKVINSISLRLRGRLYRLSAVVMISMGTILIIRTF